MSTVLAQGDICAFDPPNTSKKPFSKKMSGIRVFEGLREFEERSNPYIIVKHQMSTVLAQGAIHISL